MNTKDKGAIAESAVLHELLKQGLCVSIPYGDNAPYDLVVDTPSGLKKVQVKTAHLSQGVIKATTTFRTGSDRRGYEIYKDLVDFIAIYCIENGKCYAIPSNECKSCLNLREEIPLNNQTTGIRYACDFELFKVIHK